MSSDVRTVPAVASDLVARARTALGPLLDPAKAGLQLAGRPFEYLGRGDPLGDEADQATDDREGVLFRALSPAQVRDGIARVTPAWIAAQVEAAILQSMPERAVADLGRTDVVDLIHRPPRPAGVLEIPSLALAPFIEAVDADARRLVEDPEQQQFRARALPAIDGTGRIINRQVARTLSVELGELEALRNAPRTDTKDQRRYDALMREAGRRARYAQAFALAARTIIAGGGRVDAPRLFRAFDAVAGLDKAPFRRGPSEYMTPGLLAQMATEIYRALGDPDYVVSFLWLCLPIKNSSHLRTNVPTEAADWGEVLMMAQLRRMIEFLRKLGVARPRFLCLTDGIVYSRYLGPYTRQQAAMYRESVRRFRSALGLDGAVVIVDAEHLLRGVPNFDAALREIRARLDAAEATDPRVAAKLLSLTRSFLFHLHAQGEDLKLLVRVVNACLRGEELATPGERTEQARLWAKAAADARWYAAHLLLMSALDVVRQVVATPFVRATVHPKPGQFAPAPVNVRDFNDAPYHRKALLRAGANPLSLDAYLGVNLWSDPSLRFVDVYVGGNRAPFLGVKV